MGGGIGAQSGPGSAMLFYALFLPCESIHLPFSLITCEKERTIRSNAKGTNGQGKPPYFISLLRIHTRADYTG